MQNGIKTPPKKGWGIISHGHAGDCADDLNGMVGEAVVVPNE